VQAQRLSWNHLKLTFAKAFTRIRDAVAALPVDREGFQQVETVVTRDHPEGANGGEGFGG